MRELYDPGVDWLEMQPNPMMAQDPAFEFLLSDRHYFVKEAIFDAELGFKKWLTELPFIGNPAQAKLVAKLQKAKNQAQQVSDAVSYRFKRTSYIYE